jgi:hypothetical protein
VSAPNVHTVTSGQLLLLALVLLAAGAAFGWIIGKPLHRQQGYLQAIEDMHRKVRVLKAQRGPLEVPAPSPAQAPAGASPPAPEPEPTEDEKWAALGFRKA